MTRRDDLRAARDRRAGAETRPAMAAVRELATAIEVPLGALGRMQAAAAKASGWRIKEPSSAQDRGLVSLVSGPEGQETYHVTAIDRDAAKGFLAMRDVFGNGGDGGR